MVLEEVKNIHQETKEVDTTNKTYSYDSLVLATETETSFFGNDEWAEHAIGDLAKVEDKNGQQVPGLAPAAMQMGIHVAEVLKEDQRLQKTRYADSYTTLRPAFRFKDKGIMAIIGKSAAVAETDKMSLRGFPAWMAWLSIHLAFLVGYRNKVAVLVSWAFTYIFDKPGARVFSSEEGCENTEINPPL